MRLESMSRFLYSIAYQIIVTYLAYSYINARLQYTNKNSRFTPTDINIIRPMNVTWGYLRKVTSYLYKPKRVTLTSPKIASPYFTFLL